MQQYYEIENGSRTLTVFHTKDSVGFDVEHYGHFSIPDTELNVFLTSDAKHFTIYTNPSKKHPNLAEKRPHLFKNEDEQVGEMTKQKDGSIEIKIQTGEPITVTITPEQTETLKKSITTGSVERYENGQYPVESVSRNGKRDRAQHS